MDAQEEGLPEKADAAPRAERRLGGERRLSRRRRGDRSAADPAPEDPPAGASGAGLASAGASGAGSLIRAPSDSGPFDSALAVARPYHFRSFDDRRLGAERRGAPSANDERLTTDDVASLLRQQD